LKIPELRFPALERQQKCIAEVLIDLDSQSRCFTLLLGCDADQNKLPGEKRNEG
jgi:hypothetical protein